MSHSSDATVDESDPAGEGATSAYPTPDPAIELYEDSEQVGVIDLDAETYEYDGGYEDIADLLETVAEDGWQVRAGGVIQCEGVGLGKELLRPLNLRSASDRSCNAEFEVVPVGFEPKRGSGLTDDRLDEMQDIMGRLAEFRAERDNEGSTSEADTQ